MKYLAFLSVAAFSFFLAPHVVLAEKEPVALERAEGEGLAGAIGHYARARSLLLEAVREFDAGLKLANPQVLIDVNEWRSDLLDRAEDLEKVLDPQPRTSEGGVTFQGDPRLLSEAYK